jgi:pilus assembly protein Flp/PilA
MPSLAKHVGAFLADEEGATMVEYGIMLALIAVVCAVAVQTLGSNVNTKFQAGGDCVTNPGSGNCP